MKPPPVVDPPDLNVPWTRLTGSEPLPASVSKRIGGSIEADRASSRVPGWLLAVLAASVLALLYSGRLPDDLIGSFGLLFVLGMLLGEGGERLPLVNRFLGGGPIVCIFGAALLVYGGVLPQRTVELSTRFLSEINFLNFYIACMITGAILSMSRDIFL